jgi:hypothetical protein
MNPVVTLLNLACGNALPPEEDGRARRVQLVIAALLLSLVFATVWGVAVAGHSGLRVMHNAYKLPVIILLSAIFAAPAGLLTWKLSGAECRASDLMLGFTSGIFGGTLVLAVLAPVVALYYASSVWAGPVLAQGAIALALLTGVVVFVRGVLKRMTGSRRTVVLPLAVFKVMQIATLLQLIALFSPILPERTSFDRGIDHVGAHMGAPVEER